MSAPVWLSEWQGRAGKRWWWPLAALGLFAGVLIWVAARSGSAAKPAPVDTASGNHPAANLPAANLPAENAPPVSPPTAGAAPAVPSPRVANDAGAAPSPTVKVVFRTFPGRPAVVMWGGKRLGFIDCNAPLVVQRPRDSGPLDVLIRATGYLPVHTRAYTFNDSNIDVKLTQLEKKDTIYGYKEPLPPDAGVPFPSESAELPE